MTPNAPSKMSRLRFGFDGSKIRASEQRGAISTAWGVGELSALAGIAGSYG